MNKKDAKKQIRALAKAGRVVMAPSEGIEAFEQESRVLLSLIGHPEALITDMSSLTDFTTREDRSEQMQRMRKLIVEFYGVDVSTKDNILEILRMCHQPVGHA